MKYFIVLLCCLLVEDGLGCHFYHARRKRDLASDIMRTEELREYFTACMDQMFENSPSNYDWRSNVDFTVLDSSWYLNTMEVYCSAAGGGSTKECWQDRIAEFLVDDDDNVLRFAQECIAHYAYDKGQDPPVNRYESRRKKRSSSRIPGYSLLGRYASCLSHSEHYSDLRRSTPDYFRLADFASQHFKDSCNSSMDGYRAEVVWPYVTVALTRSDSPLRPLLESCALETFPPPSFWATWGGWSSCSSTCGRGARTRQRTCRSGVDPSETASDCRGPAIERQSCGKSCDRYNWGPWSRYRHCSQSCGGGRQTRSRSCLRNRRQEVSGSYCRPGESEEVRSCNEHECPTVHPPSIFAWSNWSGYTDCVRTSGCGLGSQSRSRRCLRRRIFQANSRFCDGDDTETRGCLTCRLISEFQVSRGPEK